MRAAYYGGSLTGSGQSVGLLEYYGTDLADLNTYFTNAKQTNNVPITLLSTDGTSTSCVDTRAGGDCDDTEQTLDMTQALGMAPGLSSLVMYVGSTDAAIFNAMATASPLNAQLSSSWTWYPADPSTDDPYFKEFAAQGQNLFQAAGDSRKWTTSGTASEIYPADDVYVTSVGGTDLTTTAAGGAWASETAWVDSGGGISPHKYAIPSWQTAAAAGCASCSQSYRNGPDVSANANFTFYVCADQTTCTANEYGGTSFAAPLWAGYLALINQQSVANGNKTLGFINPSLYSIGASSSYGADFHDITSGSNGYSATTGYDLATGWGSPNGSGLLNALAGTVAATRLQPERFARLGFSRAGRFRLLHHHQHGERRIQYCGRADGFGISVGRDGQLWLARLDHRHGQPGHVDYGCFRFNRIARHLSHHCDGNLRLNGRNHYCFSHGHRSGLTGVHHLRLAQFGIAGSGAERVRHRDHCGLRRVQLGDFAQRDGLPLGRDRQLQPESHRRARLGHVEVHADGIQIRQARNLSHHHHRHRRGHYAYHHAYI